VARRSKKKKKLYWIPVLIVLLAGGYFGYVYYQKWFAPNVVKTGKLYIPTHAGYGQMLDSLRPFLKDTESFEWLARQKKYNLRIKPGRYTLRKNESNNEIINRLRIGAQDEIAIRVGNYSSIFELAGRVAPFLECDSQQIVAAIVTADFSKGYDTANMLHFFFPETYNFHWNTSGTQFVARMKKQYDQFWNEERIQEAKQVNMTPLSVTILASIVQLESAMADEQPRVAGLYLNRLKKGMKLDADPTVIYAMKRAEGFKRKIQRVYYKNLFIESPYNTYRYKGLPPGPICMPNTSALNAVLHPVQHNYLFFVADPQKPGYHIYAETLQQQEENADRYRKWLDQNKIQ
jgi:UPF0755 protein